MFSFLKQHTWYFFLVSLFILLPQSAYAEVKLVEKNEYYAVSGVGKKAIIESMKRNSPHRSGNKFFPAYTKTDIKYSYTWGKSRGKCAIKKVLIDLKLTYKYPRLVTPQSKEVQKWWNEKIRRFIIHENIHGDISKRAAYSLDRTLRTLKGIRCSTAKSVIAKKAKFLILHMKREQIEYDKITNHGLQQYKYRPPR